MDAQFNESVASVIFSGAGTPAERAIVHQATSPVFDELLARSEQEARAGAKIIVWPECSDAVLLQEDEAAVLARASALAHTTGSYLDLGTCVLPQDPTQFRDEITLIDPSGSIVWRYEKAYPMMGVERERPGDGVVPTVQTPYGWLSSVICTDADHLSLLRQAGQSGADLMLVPSNDWPEIDPVHTQAIAFRAIENGYSLVRQTSNGLAMTVDYEGNVLAAVDDYTTDRQAMVAYVPTRGVRTPYATLGDWFAWVAIGTLVVLVGLAFARRSTPGEAVAVEVPSTYVREEAHVK